MSRRSRSELEPQFLSPQLRHSSLGLCHSVSTQHPALLGFPGLSASSSRHGSIVDGASSNQSCQPVKWIGV